MKKVLGFVLAAATLSAGFAAGAYADEPASETRTVDSRVTRVHLEGVIDLRVRQGDTPSLVIFADRSLLPEIKSNQNADTLSINSQIHSRWRGREHGTIRAELVLPQLRELDSRGVGGSQVIGFSGDDFKVVLEGSGSINVVSQYKQINANLAGVGHIHLQAGDCDRIEVSMPGAGNITAIGKAKELSANVGGVGSLDARQLTVDTLKLGLNGVGGATVTVKQAANIDLNGIGSATIYGQPTVRNVTMNGIGKAIWK